MGERLKDKVGVVTGAGRGIGRAVAMLLAEEGAKVVVNDLGATEDGSGASDSPANQVVEEIKAKGGEAVANLDTVATAEGGRNIIQTAVDNFGKVDILVNNAGILRDRMVFNMSPEMWDIVVKVHLFGCFYTIQPASVIMRGQRSGRIVNMSSSSGRGNIGQANYSAAKEGIIGLTRTVARDLGKYGITCNAIRPGAATRLTLSPEMMAAQKKQEERAAAGVEEGAGAARGMAALAGGLATWKPEDVASFTVWLCTDAAANVNGYDFNVHGGHVGLLSQPNEIKCIDKEGGWTLDDLDRFATKSLTADLENPAPPQQPK